MPSYIKQNGQVSKYKNPPKKTSSKPKEQIHPDHQRVILKLLDKYSIRDTIRQSRQLYIYNSFTIQHLIDNYLRNKPNFYEQIQGFAVRVF